MIRLGLKARLTAAAAGALALAACDDRAGRVDAPEPASLADLSAMSELPYAEPARVDYRPPAQGYAWAERAYGLQRAVYDTPPDYGFDYGGVEPLVWETGDDWVMYAEPWDEGYRYYYYEPGSYYPYFVRDDRYGYGYGAGGVLVAVFDLGGRYLPLQTVYSVAPVAGRYYARGHDLRTAAVKARRIRVTEQAWSERAPQVIRTADPWLRAARDDRSWRAWRERDQDRELRRFEPEADRRAVRTRAWRERDDAREAAVIQANDQRSRREAQIQRRALNPAREAAERQPKAEQAERRQAVADQRAQAERAQRQRQEAEGRQRQVEQRQRQQAQQEQRRAEQAQQSMRQQAQQRQAQQQQAERQRQQVHLQREQAQQQRRGQPAQQGRQAPQQRQEQVQARAAQQHGQPAASRERGGGQGRADGVQGHGRGHDRKD